MQVELPVWEGYVVISELHVQKKIFEQTLYRSVFTKSLLYKKNASFLLASILNIFCVFLLTAFLTFKINIADEFIPLFSIIFISRC